jgi:hypothetical protein
MGNFDVSEELIRIAQNDYMIDGNYLPDGKLLIFAAKKLKYHMKINEEYFLEVGSLREYIGELEDKIVSEEFWKEMNNE